MRWFHALENKSNTQPEKGIDMFLDFSFFCPLQISFFSLILSADLDVATFTFETFPVLEGADRKSTEMVSS
jgi:hypothetical protein